MIQLDPSNTTELSNVNNGFNVINYRIVPETDDFTSVIDSGLWNFDFCAVLGHNLASASARMEIQAGSDIDNSADVLNSSNIVNFVSGSYPEYDGWSLFNINEKPTNDHRGFRFGFLPLQNQSFTETPIQIGSKCGVKHLHFHKIAI